MVPFIKVKEVDQGETFVNVQRITHFSRAITQVEGKNIQITELWIDADVLFIIETPPQLVAKISEAVQQMARSLGHLVKEGIAA